MIREGKTHQLNSVLQTGAQSSMQTFEQGLQKRIEAGLLGGNGAEAGGFLALLTLEPTFQNNHRRGGV